MQDWIAFTDMQSGAVDLFPVDLCQPRSLERKIPIAHTFLSFQQRTEPDNKWQRLSLIYPSGKSAAEVSYPERCGAAVDLAVGCFFQLLLLYMIKLKTGNDVINVCASSKKMCVSVCVHGLLSQLTNYV